MSDDPADDVVAACRDLLALREAARRQEVALVGRRQEAIRRLVASGDVSARSAPTYLRDRLRAAGIPEADLRGLGVSYAAVRAAVERR